MNMPDTLVCVIAAAILGGIGGYYWDKAQEKRLFAGCPEEKGRKPATVTITPSGDVVCVYVRTPGIVGEARRKGALK